MSKNDQAVTYLIAIIIIIAITSDKLLYQLSERSWKSMAVEFVSESMFCTDRADTPEVGEETASSGICGH